MTLGEIFDKRGSDKGTNGHNYGPDYELYISPMQVSCMLEIGVANGASLLGWHDWMPHAEIHGVDIATMPECLAVFPSIHFHQCDAKFLETCDLPEHFDFIVDDGSHDPAEVLAAFFRMWPRVVAGGWYVVEDMYAVRWMALREILEWCAMKHQMPEVHIHGELLLFRKK